MRLIIEKTRDAYRFRVALDGGKSQEIPFREQRLAAEILTPAELFRLEALPSEQRAQRISLTFSLKESLFKALYPQVLQHFYFQDAELLSIDADNNVRMRLLIDLHANWPAGSELAGQFAEFDGYLLSLVSIPR